MSCEIVGRRRGMPRLHASVCASFTDSHGLRQTERFLSYSASERSILQDIGLVARHVGNGLDECLNLPERTLRLSPEQSEWVCVKKAIQGINMDLSKDRNVSRRECDGDNSHNNPAIPSTAF
ncbi:unnamed protein product [Ectocarpus sp. 12 AP-2014]